MKSANWVVMTLIDLHLEDGPARLDVLQREAKQAPNHWSGNEYLILMQKKKDRPGRKPAKQKWFVYLLRCANGSLYTGITKDVKRRCQQHNAGTASRYTRSHLPVKMVYRETAVSRSLALKREAAIKAMTRAEKLALIRLKAKAK